MSITINEHAMTSDVTAHEARLERFGPGLTWTVSWIGDDFPVDRNQAVSAMVIAEYVVQGRGDSPLVRDLAGELGFPETEAIYCVFNAPVPSRPGAFSDEEVDRCHEATEFDHQCRVCDPTRT